MKFESFIVIALGVVLVALFALAWYTEQRRRRFGFVPSEDRIFRCKKCSYVYTDDPDVDLSRCPHCGTGNDEIKF